MKTKYKYFILILVTILTSILIYNYIEENVEIAQRGGKIAGEARKNIEADTGKAVITSQNATELNKVVTDLIEGTVEDTNNKE